MTTVAPSAKTVHLHPQDNVVVALQNLARGSVIDLPPRGHLPAESLSLVDDIRSGHKIAIERIAIDMPVRKFGWPIGVATQTIEPGGHVHMHNVRSNHKIDLDAIATEIPESPTPLTGFTFDGYERANGQAGTRNYIAIISNVNCSASVASRIARHFEGDALKAFPNLDGVVAFRHDSGCAMQWKGSRHRMLTQVLGGMAKHPNIGGYLLVGLGCEQGSLDHLVESQNLHQILLPDGSLAGRNGQRSSEASSSEPTPVPVLTIQNSGGTQKTIDEGIEIVKRLLPQVNSAKRTKVSVSKLVLGLECGGSDGYSGITANPALGAAADMIVACGGTVVLSETPEVVGAEHLLTRRSRSRTVADKLLKQIEWWKWHCDVYGDVLDNNPSIGNKEGGLTTITEKSLGAVAKGGTTALEAVYEYAEPITDHGFVFMDSPGFDPASVTGMVAGGANLVAFTTGRGSCFGFKPAPCFKIASNSALFRKLPDDMDFNAGPVVEGKSVQEVGESMFHELLRIASGKPTCSEKLGLGDEEFVPWMVGPVL